MALGEAVPAARRARKPEAADAGLNDPVGTALLVAEALNAHGVLGRWGAMQESAANRRPGPGVD